jgi:hypothetical protein
MGIMGIAGALLAFSGIWLYRVAGQMPEPIVLHFNAEVGINQIGSKNALYLLWWVAAAAWMLNLRIAGALRSRSPVLAIIVASGTLAWVILLFLYFAAIISLHL